MPDATPFEPMPLPAAVNDGVFVPSARPAPARPVAAVPDVVPLYDVPVAAPLATFTGAPASIPEAVVREARARAEAQGYADGLARGRADARAEGAAETDRVRLAADLAVTAARADVIRAVEALQRAVVDLEGQAVATAADLQEELVGGVVALTEALLGHSLREGSSTALDTIRRAVLALPPATTGGDEPDPVQIALHPADLVQLEAAGVPDRVAGRAVQLLPDPDLSPGDAVARCGATAVDARLAVAVRRAARELGA